MIVDNLISKNDINVNGDIIVDVNGVAENAIYDINGRDISKLNISEKAVRDDNLLNAFNDIIFDVKRCEPTSDGVERAWARVCYGNGKFVAINGTVGDKVAYSEDGVNWKLATLPVSTDLVNICYGDGKFVANSSANITVYSTDGINWNQSTLPDTPSGGIWTGICYGNGKFVTICRYSDIGAYSEDGVNWSQTSLPSISIWHDVCYGNGKFIAVQYQEDKVSYSEDGINWSVATLPAISSWHYACYGNGKFIIFDYSINIVAYSEDCINWKSAALLAPTPNVWRGGYIGNGKFVAIYQTVNGSDIAAYSEDGVNWKPATLSVYGNYASMCYANNKILIANYGSSSPVSILSCTKLVNNTIDYIDECTKALSNNKGKFNINDWECVDSPVIRSGRSWYHMCYGDGKFVAVSFEPSGDIIYSYNGIDWERARNCGHSGLAGVCYGNGKFVITVPNDNIIMYSEDGINWTSTSIPAPATGQWWDVCYGNGKFVTTSKNGNNAAYSTDGINWTVATLPNSSEWCNICYGNNKFITTSNNTDSVAYSTDGINWTQVSLQHDSKPVIMCYGDGTFIVIVKNSDILYRSENGIDWEKITIPISDWAWVCYGDGKFIAIDTTNIVLYSDDGGRHWNKTTNGFSSYDGWSTMCYGDGKFVSLSWFSYGSTVPAAYVLSR